jgi:hypothetical protein
MMYAVGWWVYRYKVIIIGWKFEISDETKGTSRGR